MSQELELTALQLAVMRALWRRGETTVPQLHEDLSRERPLALTTVATLVRRLEKRGLLARRDETRPYRYRPLVDQDTVRRSMLGDLANRLFAGDVTSLVSHLLDASELRSGDLERMERMIQAKKRGEHHS